MAKILMAMILSLDGLGIGASYGLRGMKIRKKSFAVIFGLSFVIIEASIILGKVLIGTVSEKAAALIGPIILISMGIYVIVQNVKEKKGKIKQKKKASAIAIEVIKNPLSCDMDNSKAIETMEAAYLAIALSIDSFGIGIGMVSIYENINIMPFLMAFFQVCFLSLGYLLGRKFKINTEKTNIESFASGGILIIIGIVGIIMK